ncbi:MAG: SurA N-terminal domain-containing protein [Weeksellaceae bacterium]|jgi:peptidyl-prolyl cis-trans isomerase D|nr:SurA N-terminal domain-containing protein [Weeksellaceae bacterium]MDX9704396.1 SurA N-terminal domain-containing protein [Weeksellaceae bacterium]
MAILGQIRKQTGLLIVVIGVAMLAFVAGDLFSENSVVKRVFTGDPNEVGKINNESITLAEFITAKSQVRSNPNFSDAQITEQIWNSLVSQKLIQSHAEKAGLEVSDGELWNYMAQQYSMTSGEELKIEIGKLKSQAEQGVPGTAEAYQNFIMNFENARPNLLRQKYMEMVNMGTLATHKEAKIQQAGNIQNATLDYGFISYDDLTAKYKIEVTDAEIEAYIKKFPKAYEVEASVNLSYVYFVNKASEEDENNVKNSLNQLLNGHISIDEVNNITDTIPSFANVTDDSAYVTKYSERPFNSEYISRKEIEQFKVQLPEDYFNFLMTASVGEIGGPFKTGDAYQLVKISGSKEISDSINSSHILITYAGTDLASRENITRTRAEAQVLADSIKNMADASNFKALVAQYSEDIGSKEKDGNIGWQARNTQGLAPAYLQFLNEHKTGEIGITESQFGFHIIKIDGIKTQTGYQFANIVKEVSASQNTSDKNFNDARNFAQEVQGKSLNDFANLAQTKGFNYDTAENITRYNNRSIIDPGSGFGNDADDAILKWAFNKKTKVGSSFLFTTAHEDQIIVYLTSRTPKGLAPASMVRDQIEPLLVQEKLTQKVNVELGENPTIDDFVSKFGAQRGSSSLTFGSANIADRGTEPLVAGAAFGMQVGQNSKAIKGKEGVYVINLKNMGNPPAVEDATFLIDQLSQQQQQKITQQLLPSMIQSANIKDTRMEKLDRQQL